MHRRDDRCLRTTQCGQQTQKEKDVMRVDHICILKKAANAQPRVHGRGNADHRLEINGWDADDFDSIDHFLGGPAIGIEGNDSDFVAKLQQVVGEFFDDTFDAAADMREVVITHEDDLQELPPPSEQRVNRRSSHEEPARSDCSARMEMLSGTSNHTDKTKPEKTP